MPGALARVPQRAILIAVAIVLLAVGARLLPSMLDSDGPRTLDEAEAKALLLDLPYDFRFRPVALPAGANGAVAGWVQGPHRTVVRFGIALGADAEPVPAPVAGTLNVSGGPAFLMTDDVLVRDEQGHLQLNDSLRTQAQSDESSRIVVAMQEALCEATIGKPCPV